MAGHNKWTQIKRQKGANDAARSTLFGKLAKRIAAESKKAGGDVTTTALRTAIDAARKENMPKDNIDRAIKKGSEAGSAAMDAVMYETYGPGGAAILIEALTDNRNRTAQEIKHLLSKNGLELAAPGSAAWAFEKTLDGYIPKTTVPMNDTDTDLLMKILEILDEHDDVESVHTNAE